MTHGPLPLDARLPGLFVGCMIFDTSATLVWWAQTIEVAGSQNE